MRHTEAHLLAAGDHPMCAFLCVPSEAPSCASRTQNVGDGFKTAGDALQGTLGLKGVAEEAEEADRAREEAVQEAVANAVDETAATAVEEPKGKPNHWQMEVALMKDVGGMPADFGGVDDLKGGGRELNRASCLTSFECRPISPLRALSFTAALSSPCRFTHR